jgi:aerobic carbon-monoxide dehydrogenase small subunit
MNVSMKINGKSVSADVDNRTLLAYFIREQAGLTGTHVGCDSSSCGCCVVVMDGTVPVKSCTMFAAMADGHEFQTVEGLADNGVLHPVCNAATAPQA